MAIPKLIEHKEYAKYLQTRVTHYEKLADIAYNILKLNYCLKACLHSSGLLYFPYLNAAYYLILLH